MTPQQIYDKVCAHLAKQKHRAVDVNGTCLYRAPNGDKCAAGCLIPDDRYLPNMERKRIAAVADITSFKLPDFIVSNIGLIIDLQDCHDFSVDKLQIQAELLKTAQIHGLTPGAEQAIKSWKR